MNFVSLDLFTHVSDVSEHLWVWEYQTEEGSHDMFMDLEEDIRFRVAEEVFVDTSPTDSQLQDNL